jgi:hypothetical protein
MAGELHDAVTLFHFNAFGGIVPVEKSGFGKFSS